MWRLILSEFFTYTEVKAMSFHELYEANAALDKYKEEMDKKAKNLNKASSRYK